MLRAFELEGAQVSWPFSVVMDGEELEQLVILDDVYDNAEYSSDTIESVDAQVRAEADRLVHLRPHV